jgi:hypothetical protein
MHTVNRGGGRHRLPPVTKSGSTAPSNDSSGISLQDGRRMLTQALASSAAALGR